MTTRLANEFKRLIVELEKTDPATAEYQMILRSFEYLNGIGTDIDSIIMGANEANEANVIEMPTAPIEMTEMVEEASTNDEQIKYSKATVRTALADAKRRGVDITKVMNDFGAENFAEIPDEKYAALMDALGAF